MDYTSLALVKDELNITTAGRDTLITRVVTAASRTVDRICGQSDRAVDYFKSETIADEQIPGRVDVEGKIVCFPRKSLITAVSAFAYRFRPTQSWQAVDATQYITTEGHDVTAWLRLQRQKIFVKLSYIGGHSADLNGLPADLVEVATVAAARFYKEAEAGLTDAIGMGELAMMVYTKAFPPRLRKMLAPYIRPVPW